MTNLRIALAQINSTVGDIDGNTGKILHYINQAKEKHSDLVVFPELAITGYPPEDLVLNPQFIEHNLKALKKIEKSTDDIIAIVGFVNRHKTNIYNSAAMLANGKLVYTYNKMHLPNYGVFDEKRYFNAGIENAVLKAKDFSFSVNICEDIWVGDVTEKRLLEYSDLLINISASPYHLGKINKRIDILKATAKKGQASVLYCNLIGGQDELIFDGRSLVLNQKGMVIGKANAFEEDLFLVDLPIKGTKALKKNKGLLNVNIDYKIKIDKTALPKAGPKSKIISQTEEVYKALLLGLHDYVKKNNFKKVALGLSGGIDSALVACIAVDALSKANVLAISMPSRYSSQATQDDARRIAKNLGIRLVKIGIDNILDSYLATLETHFTGMNPDITEENIQARIRGNILMAFSNKFGYLVINTGNKSEISVGYCTLYGDTAGGFSVVKDVPKHLIYELAKYVNTKENREVIPKSVFDRPPSAELRPDQKDEDTLPPYGLLDNIVDLYVEKNKSFLEIVKIVGHKDIVKKVLRMIDSNEYKRRQSAPGIKITPKSFGKDRRMPITNRYIPF